MLENYVNYLDPGSGSMVIQMLIGALVGVGISLKYFGIELRLN